MHASFSGRSSFASTTWVDGAKTPPALSPAQHNRGSWARGYDTGCLSTGPALRRRSNLLSERHRRARIQASKDEEDRPVKYNTEFGYSRKDVLLLGAGLIGVGYALYYAAQAAGVEATTAGNYVQLFIFFIICIGYVSTYILRVANKDMTYARQLEDYEERVMQKRLEEMPETERERLLEEVEQAKSKK